MAALVLKEVEQKAAKNLKDTNEKWSREHEETRAKAAAELKHF